MTLIIFTVAVLCAIVQCTHPVSVDLQSSDVVMDKIKEEREKVNVDIY